jgi:hypothetical protein
MEMNAPDAGSGTTREPAAGEPWQTVADELLGAVNHALNNRLAALISLVRVLEFGETGTNPLFDVLREEVDRLEQTTVLLRLLPREPNEAPEAARLTDLLEPALALHRLRGRARDLDYQIVEGGDSTPVRVPPTATTHALLILLAALTPASAPSGAGPIRIAFSEADGEARMSVELPPEITAALDDGEGEANTRLAAVGALLRGMGGSLVRGEATAGAARGVEVRFPTLAASRRADGAGGPRG